MPTVDDANRVQRQLTDCRLDQDVPFQQIAWLFGWLDASWRGHELASLPRHGFRANSKVVDLRPTRDPEF